MSRTVWYVQLSAHTTQPFFCFTLQGESLRLRLGLRLRLVVGSCPSTLQIGLVGLLFYYCSFVCRLGLLVCTYFSYLYFSVSNPLTPLTSVLYFNTRVLECTSLHSLHSLGK